MAAGVSVGLLYRPRKYTFSAGLLSFPRWLEGYLNIFDYVVHRTYRNPLYLPGGNLSSQDQDGNGRWHVFSPPFFFFFCAWIYDRPFSFLHLCRSKQEVAPALTSKTVRLWIKKPMKRRRENINKNIKRRHLLFDCCVHLYTSLHHYGLFSLQIKPKIVQITRRLKSF